MPKALAGVSGITFSDAEQNRVVQGVNVITIRETLEDDITACNKCFTRRGGMTREEG